MTDTIRGLIIGALLVLCLGMSKREEEFAVAKGPWNASICTYRQGIYVCIVNTRTGEYRVERWEK